MRSLCSSAPPYPCTIISPQSPLTRTKGSSTRQSLPDLTTNQSVPTQNAISAQLTTTSSQELGQNRITILSSLIGDITHRPKRCSKLSLLLLYTCPSSPKKPRIWGTSRPKVLTSSMRLICCSMIRSPQESKASTDLRSQLQCKLNT